MRKPTSNALRYMYRKAVVDYEQHPHTRLASPHFQHPVSRSYLSSWWDWFQLSAQSSQITQRRIALPPHPLSNDRNEARIRKLKKHSSSEKLVFRGQTSMRLHCGKFFEKQQAFEWGNFSTTIQKWLYINLFSISLHKTKFRTTGSRWASDTVPGEEDLGLIEPSLPSPILAKCKNCRPFRDAFWKMIVEIAISNPFWRSHPLRNLFFPSENCVFPPFFFFFFFRYTTSSLVTYKLSFFTKEKEKKKRVVWLITRVVFLLREPLKSS